MLLNDRWTKEEIKKETEKFLETNDNGNTILQNMWDTAKAVLGGKCMAISVYTSKEEKLQSICDYLENTISYYDWVGFYFKNGDKNGQLFLQIAYKIFKHQ